MKGNPNRKLPSENDEALYISPNNLAKRWDCSRSSADRAAKNAKLQTFFLGSGKNGNIRYLLAAIEEFERNRTV